MVEGVDVSTGEREREKARLSFPLQILIFPELYFCYIKIHRAHIVSCSGWSPVVQLRTCESGKIKKQ